MTIMAITLSNTLYNKPFIMCNNVNDLLLFLNSILWPSEDDSVQLVMIDIADENDNPPYFKHDFYKAGETAGLSWFVASYCMSRMFPLLITQQTLLLLEGFKLFSLRLTLNLKATAINWIVSRCTYMYAITVILKPINLKEAWWFKCASYLGLLIPFLKVSPKMRNTKVG